MKVKMATTKGKLAPGDFVSSSFLLFLLVCQMNTKIALAEEIPVSIESDSSPHSSRGQLLHYNYAAYPNMDSYGSVLSQANIPARPVRRIGSEFLGKRSFANNEDSVEMGWEGQPSADKRGRERMGSEFLGKRRLGSEFLGKRFDPSSSDGDAFAFANNYGTRTFLNDGSQTAFSKRAIGSEFLGKRRLASPYDWAWKRARLGSEFLGKKKRAF